MVIHHENAGGGKKLGCFGSTHNAEILGRGESQGIICPKIPRGMFVPLDMRGPKARRNFRSQTGKDSCGENPQYTPGIRRQRTVRMYWTYDASFDRACSSRCMRQT